MMSRSLCLSRLLVLAAAAVIGRVFPQQIEEFHISSPMDLHGLAMDKFLQYRKEVDPQASLDYDSPLMKGAHDYAVSRFNAKSESELKLWVSNIVMIMLSCNSWVSSLFLSAISTTLL